MKLSIIIPTFNRSELLTKTLTFLYHQSNVSQNDYEIIVVDDGSTDDTKIVFQEYKVKLSNLKYIFRQRDSLSSRGRARNLGINNSNGDIVLFLDTGVIVSNNFVENIFNIFNKNIPNIGNTVVYHYVLGMFVDPDDSDTKVINNLSPDNIDSIGIRLKDKSEWIDRREGLFNYSNNLINRLSAPWSIGWTAAFTTTREMLEKIGGFDEAFLGWGAEDTDLSYRIYKNKGLFISDSASLAIHFPHKSSSESNEEMSISNSRNELLLHKKNNEFDTELYLLYPGPYYSQVLSRYNSIVLQYIIPWYQTNLIEYLNNVTSQCQKSLLIGSDIPAFINGINVTDAFIQNKEMKVHLQNKLSHLNLHYLLGINTPFNDNYFDVVIITDYIRMFNERIQQHIIKEICRISKKVIIVYTDDFVSVIKEIDDYPWLSMDEIRKTILHVGYEIIEINQIHSQKIFEIINIS